MNREHLATKTRKPRIHMYLSDEAYEALVTSGVNLQYITPRANHKSVKGLTYYLEALSHATLVDTRPEYVRETDLQRLEAGHLPYWSEENVRRPRYIAMSAETQQRFRAHALQIGVTNTRASTSVDIFRSPISALLEAVGIGWLTPVNVPTNPHPRKKTERGL